MSEIIPKEKVCLIVIDGWGIREEEHGNAIMKARTPNMDKLSKNSINIEASEVNVGLPEGQMGNSEVGHLNIGAGRIVYQDILRINMSIKSGEILKNPTLINACKRAKDVSGDRIHLIGLCSDGGVHSHISHIISIIDACKTLKVKECHLHFIADGRDTSPTSGATFLRQIISHLHDISYGKLSTIVGRYYAMDRDSRWDRVKVAFDAMCYGIGASTSVDLVADQIQESYSKGQSYTDEFLTPLIFGDADFRVKDNDTLIFLNYRSDRMREIVQSFGIEPSFDSKLPKNLKVICMTQYNPSFTFEMLFPPVFLDNVLSQWLSVHKIKQLHVAETEKFAHVTYFFNGGVQKLFELEDRSLVPSPKVPTYDLKPEMSVIQVADEVIKGIHKGYPFIVVNLAPPDMVGHTGMFEPTVIACEYTDTEIGRIYESCKEHGYVLMVTADHGNAEKMYDENNNPHTAHTLYPVPLIITSGYRLRHPTERKPALCDVAVTVLDVMGVPKPPQMLGVSLLAK